MAAEPAVKDDWGPPIHAEPTHADDWGDAIHAEPSTPIRMDFNVDTKSGRIVPPPPSEKPPVDEKSYGTPLDDTEHSASAGTIARASLAADPLVQIKRYAEAFKQPVSDFGIVGEHIVRKVPGTDKYARVEPSVRGATGPIDAAERAFDWVASGVGPSYPMVGQGIGMALGAAAGLETGPGAIVPAMAGGAAGGVIGDTARQKLDAWLAPKGEEAPFDYKQAAHEGEFGAAGPLIGKAIEVAAPPLMRILAKSAPNDAANFVGREGFAGGDEFAAREGANSAADAAGAATADAAGGAASPNAGSAGADTVSPKELNLSPEELASLERQAAAHRAEYEKIDKALAMFREAGAPVDLSLGQKTGSVVLQRQERRMLRDPSTAQDVTDLREAQNETQIPNLVKKGVLDTISPSAPKSEAIDPFREASEAVVKKEVGERSDMANFMYRPLEEGKSIAPLEDQFRKATIQATAEKGQIARQMSDLEKAYPTVVGDRALPPGSPGPIHPAMQEKHANVREQYAELQARLGEAEETRQAFLAKFKEAQADGTGNKPGAVWSPRLQAMMDHPDVQKGINEELHRMSLENLGDKFDPSDYAVVGTNPDGTYKIGAVPNARLVMAGKRGLDAIIEANIIDGVPNATARAATIAKNKYLSEADKLLPGFAEARAKYGTDSEAINAIKEGGVGLLNRMQGNDRQGMITKIFKGDAVTPEDISEMRRQFIYAGKGNEWNAALRSHIEDVLSDAIKTTDESAGNLGKKLHKSLFKDEDQANVIRAALGDNAKALERWDALGTVLQAAKNNLAEGSATATDIGSSPILKRISLAMNIIARPHAIPGEALDMAASAQSEAAARQFAKYALTPEGDKILRALYLQTPSSPKAMELLDQMFSKAGLYVKKFIGDLRSTLDGTYKPGPGERGMLDMGPATIAADNSLLSKAEVQPSSYFEIAPGAVNTPEEQKLFETLHPSAKAAVSNKLIGETLPVWQRASGIKGEVRPGLGGFQGSTNQNYKFVPENPEDLARAQNELGHIYGQDMMMSTSAEPFANAQKSGVVRIEIPKDMSPEDVHNLYMKLNSEGLAEGHSTDIGSGTIDILTSEDGLASTAHSIDNALGGKYSVKGYTTYVDMPSTGVDYARPNIPGVSDPGSPSAPQAEYLDSIKDAIASRRKALVGEALRQGAGNEGEVTLADRGLINATSKTPQEARIEPLTVNSILHPDFPAEKARSKNVSDIAKMLDERGRSALKELGIRAKQILGPDPKTDELIASAIASEVKSALSRSGRNALDWYTTKVRQAISVAAIDHPEIETDQNARMAFTSALAITSQGETVPSNVRLANQVYEAYKKNRQVSD